VGIYWPFAGFNPQNPFVQRFVWRYRRAIDLGCAQAGCSPINHRIIGGRPVNPHQFKFVAALLTEDYQGRVRQFCGGSIIDEYHILTAAHCVASYTEDDVRRLRVQLGVHDIKNTPGKSTHKVDRIIRHIDFSQRTLVSRFRL
jgi:secreted trypsin-like serine protease